MSNQVRRALPLSMRNSAEEILVLVEKYTGVPREHISSGKTRTCHIVSARLLWYYVLREATGYSFPEIGLLVNRDHTTIMSGHHVMAQRVAAADADVAADIAALVEKARSKVLRTPWEKLCAQVALAKTRAPVADA